MPWYMSLSQCAANWDELERWHRWASDENWARRRTSKIVQNTWAMYTYYNGILIQEQNIRWPLLGHQAVLHPTLAVPTPHPSGPHPTTLFCRCLCESMDMLYYIMSCHVMQCYAMLCYAMLCYFFWPGFHYLVQNFIMYSKLPLLCPSPTPATPLVARAVEWILSGSTP